MKFKSGVQLSLGIQPVTFDAIHQVAKIYERHGQELVVTSVLDGAHQRGSRHFLGLAFDARTRFFVPAEQLEVSEACKESLGPEYDVVLESNHLHIEYDPK